MNDKAGHICLPSAQVNDSALKQDSVSKEIHLALIDLMKIQKDHIHQVYTENANSKASRDDNLTAERGNTLPDCSKSCAKSKHARADLMKINGSVKDNADQDVHALREEYRLLRKFNLDGSYPIPIDDDDHSDAEQKEVPYLSIYKKLPSSAPQNHAHIILDEDDEPASNLDLPESDCWLPDILVSAIHKYSPEALDAFLGISQCLEFWFLCRMSARSVHYHFSICRRRSNAQVRSLLTRTRTCVRAHIEIIAC